MVGMAGRIQHDTGCKPVRRIPAVPRRDGLIPSVGHLAPGQTGRGYGRLLLERLIQECRALGLREMVAVIGDSANLASIELHRRLGFDQVGVLRRVGFKFDRWIDSVLMQLPLRPDSANLA